MLAGRKVMLADTGCANLASVRFAFARLGVQAAISSDPDELRKADRLVLPGVGSANAGMLALRKSGLDKMLSEYQRPLLGICLGMQLLFEHSDEGNTNCLGLVKANVQALNVKSSPVPHMGWNTLRLVSDDDFLKGIEQESYVYFVHSYAANPDENTLAVTNYEDDFSAIIRHENLYGCQFHPELSGAAGAKILQNFLEVS